MPPRRTPAERALEPDELRDLFRFRVALRRYLRWSEEQVVAAGLTPARHQLLLAVAGHDDPAGPTITDLADALLVRHHSAVGLIDRAAEAGLVERVADRARHRSVRVRLTDEGRHRLDAVTPMHRRELDRIAPHVEPLRDALHDVAPEPPPPRPPHERSR